MDGGVVPRHHGVSLPENVVFADHGHLRHAEPRRDVWHFLLPRPLHAAGDVGAGELDVDKLAVDVQENVTITDISQDEEVCDSCAI